jgi:hypothetical protein
MGRKKIDKRDKVSTAVPPWRYHVSQGTWRFTRGKANVCERRFKETVNLLTTLGKFREVCRARIPVN